MRDHDSFIAHCYDLLLQTAPQAADKKQKDEELCVCSKLIERSEA